MARTMRVSLRLAALLLALAACGVSVLSGGRDDYVGWRPEPNPPPDKVDLLLTRSTMTRESREQSHLVPIT
jgi:hypothetical protein